MDKGRVLPELISGPRSGLAWVVKECKAMDSKVKLKDGSQSIQVPARTLRQDWLVQQHELTHVADIREMAQLPKDKHARRFFKMLCEIAVEAISLHRNGVDIRQARDHLDWASFPLPEADDVTQWAQLWLQFTFSADASEHPGVKMIYQRACDTLGAERVGWLCQARDAVVLDPSGKMRLAWADWLGKCFPRHADTPPPSKQPEPEPSKGSGEPEESDDSAESDDSTGNDSESQEEPNAAENTDQSEESQEETGEPSESDDAGESDTDDDTGSDGGDDSDADDDSDAGDTGDTGDGGIETTDQDDDEWETPSEQVEERGGAGRLRAALEQEAEAKDAKERLERAIDAAWNPDAEHGVWIIGGAKIDIHRHTATRVARKLPGRGGSKASDTGPRLAFPRRLYQDGRVLARTGRHGGGILVDGSGSMAWNQDKVDAACAILPGLWVGWYSLHQAAYKWARANLDHVYRPSADNYARLRREAPYWARLCIIAERGRVAEYKPGLETEHSGGNEVDGDCLAYFARVCQGPKIWVSDGQVYGAPGHAEQCAKVMRQAGIVRVDMVDDAVAYLSGRAVMGYRDCSTRKYKLVKG